VQHLPHFNQAFAESDVVACADCSKITGHYEVRLELVSGVERDIQIPRELSIASLSASFHNVCVDRSDRPKSLAAKRDIVCAANAVGYVVDCKYKLMGFLPHFKFPEIGHGSNIGASSSEDVIALFRTKTFPFVAQSRPLAKLAAGGTVCSELRISGQHVAES
jgi:hypothetical protein